MPGPVARSLTGHLIDTAGSMASGYPTGFLVTAAVMLLTGAFAVLAIRPEKDARGLGL